MSKIEQERCAFGRGAYAIQADGASHERGIEETVCPAGGSGIDGNGRVSTIYRADGWTAPAGNGAATSIDAATVTPWPLRIDSSAGTISIYQPQPETYQGNQLTARAAISLIPPGESEPQFGAMWMSAHVNGDAAARTATIIDAQISQVRLPTVSDAQEKQVSQTLQDLFPQLNVTFSQDQLIASLDEAAKEQQATGQLQVSPPKILFSNHPAVLVVLDGEPKLQPVETAGVMRVINTPFVILMDLHEKRYFLKAGQAWLSSAEVSGPWAVAGAVPGEIAEAASKLTSPAAQDGAANPNAAGVILEIIVAQQPSELIMTDGDPQYTPLPGNNLLYVSNTQADLFMEVTTQQYYVLLSGRWYRSSSLQGPWEFVAAEMLPAAFAQIPQDSPKAHVLVSVAGTNQAAQARVDAQVPLATAPIRRDAGANLTVTYDGDPQFAPVEGTQVTYAQNTPDPVLCVRRTYYCCHQGVWYESGAPRADGMSACMCRGRFIRCRPVVLFTTLAMYMCMKRRRTMSTAATSPDTPAATSTDQPLSTAPAMCIPAGIAQCTCRSRVPMATRRAMTGGHPPGALALTIAMTTIG